MKDCSISNEQMEEVYKTIGQNVKRVRTSKNISQLALSLAIGHKSVGTIAVAEIYHKNKHFNIEHLVKIANVLEVDICEFFKDIK
ncbi:helix-turn-helix domain-containing protein [Aliarcobacter vitoriensis]|uniref:Transcriptional regulator n=1 Tax=Aliarcobacter vitoriensis TaxID=2011099 RepID=A0A366MUW6_9BACT|nr:helix-turn-helix transcriptional regulator [Aliarcobacter vitoriensis]RBQ29279.1 transcriptional regulator [Aliarcobacter vitoriensis]